MNALEYCHAVENKNSYGTNSGIRAASSSDSRPEPRLTGARGGSNVSGMANVMVFKGANFGEQVLCNKGFILFFYCYEVM